MINKCIFADKNIDHSFIDVPLSVGLCVCGSVFLCVVSAHKRASRLPLFPLWLSPSATGFLQKLASWIQSGLMDF